MLKKVCVALGISLMIGLTGTAQAQEDQSLQRIKDRGTIKIGLMLDFPPYASSGAGNKPDGYDAEVAQMLADYLGVKVEPVITTGPNRIPYLLTDKADVLVASLAITPERQEQVQFSNPYSAASMVLLGPADIVVDSPADFTKYKIGVPRASTTDIGVMKIAPEGTDIRRFDDDASALQAMIVGQVDLAGTSTVIASEVQKRHPGKFEIRYVINEQVMGVTMQKDRPELEAAVNAFLKEKLADGSLDKAFEKWLGTPLPASVHAASN